MRISPAIRAAAALALGFALAIAVSAGIVSAATSPDCSSADFPGTPAPPLFPSCFEAADGNMIRDAGSSKALDWDSVSGNAGVVVSDGTGATDDTFVVGSKEEQPSGWAIHAAPASPKDDVFSAARSVESLAGHVFLEVGFIEQAANGSFDASVELDQAAPPTGSALPSRANGDLLLTFDSVGGSVTIAACTWQGNATSGQWLLLDGTAVDDTSSKACTQLNGSTPSAQGAVNGSIVPAAQNPVSSIDLTAGNFAEMSVDLTRVLGRVACSNFQSWWMRTRASIQATSNPEDFVAPRALSIPNCPAPPTPTGPTTTSTGTSTPTTTTTGRPPPPRPSNRFTFGHLRFNAARAISILTVTLPGPGSLKLAGKGVVRSTHRVRAKGQVKLVISLTHRARRLMRLRGRARVRIVVTYTPSGGRPRSRARTIVFSAGGRTARAPDCSSRCRLD